MTSYDFPTTAYVVMILTGVALLAVVSAVTLVPFDRSRGRRGMVFMVCMAGIWAVAVLVIARLSRII
jgi:uncharacterized membrane protein YwaF